MTCVIYINEAYFVEEFQNLHSSQRLMKEIGVIFVSA